MPIEVVVLTPAWQAIASHAITLLVGIGGVFLGASLSSRSQKRVEEARLEASRRLEQQRMQHLAQLNAAAQRSALLQYEASYLATISDRVSDVLGQVDATYLWLIAKCVELQDRWDDSALSQVRSEWSQRHLSGLIRLKAIGPLIPPGLEEAFAAMPVGMAEFFGSVKAELDGAVGTRSIDVRKLQPLYERFIATETIRAEIRVRIVNHLEESQGSGTRYGVAQDDVRPSGGADSP